MKKKIITLSIISGIIAIALIISTILLVIFYDYDWIVGDVIYPTKYINYTIVIFLLISYIFVFSILIINLYKLRKNNKIKEDNNKKNKKSIVVKKNETLICNIFEPKKKLNTITKKKISLYILIGIISILAITQTILLLTIVFSFVAYALAVPTTLLTIIAILKYIEINKHD